MCMKTKMLAFVCLLCDPQRAALGVQPGPFAFIGVLLDYYYYYYDDDDDY